MLAPAKRLIFMTFCDAVRFFNIFVFDLYMQWPMHHFFFFFFFFFFFVHLAIFMLLPGCTGHEN